MWFIVAFKLKNGVHTIVLLLNDGQPHLGRWWTELSRQAVMAEEVGGDGPRGYKLRAEDRIAITSSSSTVSSS